MRQRDTHHLITALYPQEHRVFDVSPYSTKKRQLIAGIRIDQPVAAQVCGLKPEQIKIDTR